MTTDVWAPPLPDEAREQHWYEKLLAANSTATEKAIDIVLHLSRFQYFENGNKRTALFAANNLLLINGAGMFAIPESKMDWYQSQLQKYDRTGNDQVIKRWLYENCLFGYQSAAQVYPTHQPEQ